MKKLKNKFKLAKPKTKRILKPLPKDQDSDIKLNANNASGSDSKTSNEDIKSSDPTSVANNDDPIIKVPPSFKKQPSKKQSLKKQPKLNSKRSKRLNVYLLLLIFLYIIIEIIFNYFLVFQMSYSTTALDIRNLERAGKIITGIGIALLMFKSLLNHFDLKFKLFLKCFVALLAIGICFSFMLQTALINYVVGNATDEDQQRALLVSAASTTLVPYYDDEAETNHIYLTERILFPFYKAINSESNYSSTQIKYQRVENFYKTSSVCTPKAIKTYANHYPINNNLNKAFFSYSHLISTQTHEELHKKAIVNYYSCIFNDDILVGMYADNLKVLKDKVENFYQEYLEKSEEYNNNLKKYPNRKNRIDRKWQSGTRDKLGFETTLPPNLEFNTFVKHPDVKTYLVNNQTIKMPYPYADNMSLELKNSLPDFILANYLIAKKEGIPEVEPKPDDETEDDGTEGDGTEGEINNEDDVSIVSKFSRFFETPTLTVSQKSYKAVMMPMIALGFSVTFLVLNVISMLSLIISNNSKKISTWFQRIVTGIFFILPFVISPSTPLIIPPNDSMLLTIVVKFLYFYQHQVWLIQQAIIGLF